jgi:hypothetical protein
VAVERWIGIGPLPLAPLVDGWSLSGKQAFYIGLNLDKVAHYILAHEQGNGDNFR